MGENGKGPRSYSRDDPRTVSIAVFAKNMTLENMTTVMERECGPVLHVRFSSSYPKQGVCIVTFEREADAKAALALGERRSPVCHGDLDIFWKKGLVIFRDTACEDEGNRRKSVSDLSPSSRPTADHVKCTEAFLASLATVPAVVDHPPETEFPPASPLLPASELSPSSSQLLAAELKEHKLKHEEVVNTNDLLRLRIDDMHRRVESTRSSLEYQNEMAAATAKRMGQTKVKIERLKADIKKAEEERASFARYQEEAEEVIVDNARLEAQLVAARASKAALEGLWANVTQRIQAEEKSRGDQALRLIMDGKLNGIAPRVKDTFMADSTLTAFWRVHELVDESITEVRAESGAPIRVERAADKKRKKRRLDEGGRTNISFRLPKT